MGLNKYRLPHEEPIDILEVDNTAVRQSQIARLETLRAEREETAVFLQKGQSPKHLPWTPLTTCAVSRTSLPK